MTMSVHEAIQCLSTVVWEGDLHLCLRTAVTAGRVLENDRYRLQCEIRKLRLVYWILEHNTIVPSPKYAAETDLLCGGPVKGGGG
jgi:hypothetical protein